MAAAFSTKTLCLKQILFHAPIADGLANEQNNRLIAPKPHDTTEENPLITLE